MQSLSELKDIDAFLLAVPVAIVFASIAVMIVTVRGRLATPVVLTDLAGAVLALAAAVLITDVRALTVNQSTLLLCIITAATAVIAHLQLRRLEPTPATVRSGPDLDSTAA